MHYNRARRREARKMRELTARIARLEDGFDHHVNWLEDQVDCLDRILAEPIDEYDQGFRDGLKAAAEVFRGVWVHVDLRGTWKGNRIYVRHNPARYEHPVMDRPDTEG